VLGRGGMGVVYRATDTKLHRPVAIKFLAAGVADEQARRRFRQEAETASSLNHPHIVTVHDVGEHDGQQYIVSELVDGGTLTDWAMRPHTWRQCVELLTGVADAIAGAHAAQVLHRDIKPGNILIGANGYAKLADFGLAKLAPRESSGVGPSPATGVGVVIGTVAYMSPEQASGQPLDARSDIFSFGAVLYELLAGQRAFEGATDLEVLKTIVHTAPAPLPRTVPDELRTVIDKALEKDPAERYQHMQDLVVDLRRAVRKSSSSSQLAASPEAAPATRRWGWIGAAGLALLALALSVPATWYFTRAPAPAQQLRFDIAARGYAGYLTISPDGERIAYTSRAGGPQQIWVRSLASPEARPIAGTEGADRLFWAPDGQRLGFIAAGKLKKVDLRGGPAQALADPHVNSGRNAWNREGTIIYSMPTAVIGRVTESGGTPTPVTTLDPSGDMGHGMLSFLEDGRHFVFDKWHPVSRPSTAGSVTVAVGSLAGEPPIELVQIPWDDRGGAPVYAGGYLFLRRGTDVAAQKLDPRSLRLSGDPLPIAGNVADFSASATGIFVYVEAATTGDAQPSTSTSFTWFNRHGEVVGRVDASHGAANPRLSPDQRRIAFNTSRTAANPDIYTIDLERGATTRRTFDAGADLTPIWSPDGSRLVFNSNRDASAVGANQIYARAANGSGGDELLFAGEPGDLVIPSAWSADGRYLLFMRARLESFTDHMDIWVLPLTGDKKPFPLIESRAVKGPAVLSPDGRWVAYATNESGKAQIVVQPFPDPSGGRWDISANGGIEPRWRGDGKELFYLGLDGAMMAVEVQSGSGNAFEFGPPGALFQTGIVIPEVVLEYFYDVAADGERFLVNVNSAGRTESASPAETTTPIHVIVNWNAPPPR
jgi:Tol biopolymer transport system component